MEKWKKKAMMVEGEFKTLNEEMKEEYSCLKKQADDYKKS